MDCFHDFCLACDKQCVDGPYCSQGCRLADLEKAQTSLPPSPLTSTGPDFERLSRSSSVFGSGSGYVLSPAYFFPEKAASHKRSSASHASLSNVLSPSSSRTSLASTTSSSVSTHGLSEQARLELQDYFSSFDHTRAAKRRSSLK